MDLQADIRWIQKELDNVKDPSLLETIINILKSRTENNPQTIDEYNDDIKLAKEDIKAGRVYFTKDLEKLKSKWKKEM